MEIWYLLWNLASVGKTTFQSSAAREWHCHQQHRSELAWYPPLYIATPGPSNTSAGLLDKLRKDRASSVHATFGQTYLLESPLAVGIWKAAGWEFRSEGCAVTSSGAEVSMAWYYSNFCAAAGILFRAGWLPSFEDSSEVVRVAFWVVALLATILWNNRFQDLKNVHYSKVPLLWNWPKWTEFDMVLLVLICMINIPIFNTKRW